MERKAMKHSAFALGALWLGLAFWAWLGPTAEFSATERRELAQLPALSWDAVSQGSFMSDFEDYTLDQFPARDGFRRLKAMFHYGVLRQLDNHGIYLSQGHAVQLEYPINTQSVDHALGVFRKITQQYLQDSKIWVGIIPDKNYYVQDGQPKMDYEALLQKIATEMDYAEYISLTDILSLEDYYRTDTHWRQENLRAVAAHLCQSLGVTQPGEFTVETLERPFYGVYYGQAALPMQPDTLRLLHNSELDGCRVYNYEKNAYTGVYDMEKAQGKDMYETFLSGPVSLLTLENPQANNGKELIIFRDSFGSSLAPLLAQGYEKITLVDVRYLPSAMLGRLLDFHGQDVLFLYSTLILNNSFQMQ